MMRLVKLIVISVTLLPSQVLSNEPRSHSNRKGLTFTCLSSKLGETVAVVFDTDKLFDMEDENFNLDVVRGVASRMIKSGAIIPLEITSETPDVFATKEVCSFSKRSPSGPSTASYVALPSTLFELGDTKFAVVDISRNSEYFDIVGSFSTTTLLGIGDDQVSLVFLSDLSRYSKIGESCKADKVQTMPSIGTTNWVFGMHSMRFTRAGDEVSIVDANHGQVIPVQISSIIEGMYLSEDIWTQFLKIFTELSIGSVTGNDDGIRISKCHNGGKIIQGYPSLTLKFASGDIRLNPSNYMEINVGDACIVKVFKGFTDKVIIGENFFRTGMIELAKDGSVSYCPAEGKVYNFEGKEIVVAIDAPSTVSTAKGATDTDLAAPVNKSTYGIFIGCTVGGIALIIGVIVFFVIKARRRHRLAKDDPRRSMIHDVSSIASGEPSSITAV